MLEIVHVETGNLARKFELNKRTVKSKFTRERVETIKEISLNTIELESVLGRFLIGYSRLGVSEVLYRPIYSARLRPLRFPFLELGALFGAGVRFYISCG